MMPLAHYSRCFFSHDSKIVKLEPLVWPGHSIPHCSEDIRCLNALFGGLTHILNYSHQPVIQPSVSEPVCNGRQSEPECRHWWSGRAAQPARSTQRCCSLQTPGSRRDQARTPAGTEGGEVDLDESDLNCWKARHLAAQDIIQEVTCPANQSSSSQAPCLSDRCRWGMTRGRRHRYHRKY